MGFNSGFEGLKYLFHVYTRMFHYHLASVCARYIHILRIYLRSLCGSGPAPWARGLANNKFDLHNKYRILAFRVPNLMSMSLLTSIRNIRTLFRRNGMYTLRESCRDCDVAAAGGCCTWLHT